jgi:hypothetical protein
MLEDVAPLVMGLGGGRLGTLKLTSRRLMWYETTSPWPLKRIAGEIDLCDVVSITQTGFLDFVFGGRRLCIRLGDGTIRKLYPGKIRLHEWVEKIRSAVSERLN